MNQVTHIILLGFMSAVLGSDCVLEQPSEQKWERLLIKDLQCNYDVKIPPKRPDTETLVVKIKFILRYFGFDSIEGSLLLHTWMHMSWNDERLKWDPTKYGGIEKSEIFSAHIWTPSMKLFNGFYPDFDRYVYEPCAITSSGNVACSKRSLLESPCNVKLTDYPYDAQECSLELGALGENNTSSYFKLNFSARAMSMLGADYGSQWFISDYKQRSEPPKQLIMTLVFEREAESLAAVIVYPSLILSCLTVACLCLDVRNKLRMMLACFTIASHYYWLTELGENIPVESMDPPRLLLYYRGSMILAVLALIKTFILNMMCKRITPPPKYVITFNDFVQEHYTRYLIFPRWYLGDEVESPEKDFHMKWTDLANILNSLSLFVGIIVYVAMYFAFIPQPIPIK